MHWLLRRLCSQTEAPPAPLSAVLADGGAFAVLTPAPHSVVLADGGAPAGLASAPLSAVGSHGVAPAVLAEAPLSAVGADGGAPAVLVEAPHLHCFLFLAMLTLALSTASVSTTAPSFTISVLPKLSRRPGAWGCRYRGLVLLPRQLLSCPCLALRTRPSHHRIAACCGGSGLLEEAVWRGAGWAAPFSTPLRLLAVSRGIYPGDDIDQHCFVSCNPCKSLLLVQGQWLLRARSLAPTTAPSSSVSVLPLSALPLPLSSMSLSALADSFSESSSTQSSAFSDRRLCHCETQVYSLISKE